MVWFLKCRFDRSHRRASSSMRVQQGNRLSTWRADCDMNGYGFKQIPGADVIRRSIRVHDIRGAVIDR